MFSCRRIWPLIPKGAVLFNWWDVSEKGNSYFFCLTEKARTSDLVLNLKFTWIHMRKELYCISHFKVLHVCLVTWPWMPARLEVTLLWYRPLCFSHLNANKLALEQLHLHSRRRSLYQNRVTSSLTAIQRLGHWADNCKMIYLALTLRAWCKEVHPDSRYHKQHRNPVSLAPQEPQN